MTREDLEQLWSVTGRSTAVGELVGRRIAGRSVSRAAYAVVDHAGRRGLYIQVPAQARAIDPVATSGLSVTTDQFRIGGGEPGRFVAMTCLRQEQLTTFGAFCADVLRETIDEDGDLVERLAGILNRWRLFWRVQPASLSREAALGLFGELWFLHRWLTCDRAEALGRWTGPSGSRHDFQWPEASVEVKTTASASDSVVHAVDRLDQLDDPAHGTLYLFSLHVADDVISEHSLPRMVDQVRSSLSGSSNLVDRFDGLLAGVGYTSVHAAIHERPLRVVSEIMYRVADDFPRLTTASLRGIRPAGVVDVSYRIAMSACERFAVARSPEVARDLLR